MERDKNKIHSLQTLAPDTIHKKKKSQQIKLRLSYLSALSAADTVELDALLDNIDTGLAFLDDITELGSDATYCSTGR